MGHLMVTHGSFMDLGSRSKRHNQTGNSLLSSMALVMISIIVQPRYGQFDDHDSIGGDARSS